MMASRHQLELSYTGLKGDHVYDSFCGQTFRNDKNNNQLLFFISIFEVHKKCCGCAVVRWTVSFTVQKAFRTKPKGFQATGRCPGDWLDLVHFTVLSGEVITTLVEVEEAAWPEAREI